MRNFVPNYDYRCNSCGNVWEQNIPLAQSDDLPACRTVNCSTPAVEKLKSAPGFSYTLGDRKKVPESFKDVLRQIKSRHLHSTIDV